MMKVLNRDNLHKGIRFVNKSVSYFQLILLMSGFIMIFNVSTVSIMFAMPSNVTETPSKEYSHAVRVLWTVDQFIMGPKPMMSRSEAQNYIFAGLDMDESSIRFDNQQCKNINFEWKSEQLSAHLYGEYGITPDDLGLSDQKVEITETTCDIDGFDRYIRLQDRRLVVNIKGVFFFFNPVVDY